MASSADRSPRRCFAARAALISIGLIAAVAVSGCGGSSGAEHSTAAQPPTVATQPIRSQPATSAAVPIVLRGDAATNPACKLATVAELEAIAGGPTVADELGLQASGSYSPKAYSCTWHFHDTELNAPAVVVQYEVSPIKHPEVVAYNKSLITQRYATAVPNLGDVAILEHFDLTIIDGTVQLHVRVQLHPGEDPAQTIAVARLVLPRIHR